MHNAQIDTRWLLTHMIQQPGDFSSISSKCLFTIGIEYITVCMTEIIICSLSPSYYGDNRLTSHRQFTAAGYSPNPLVGARLVTYSDDGDEANDGAWVVLNI